jgi:hypothetical protein
LEQLYDVPKDLVGMTKYLAHPQHNPRTKRVIFYTRFITTTSFTELKKDYSYLDWLKKIRFSFGRWQSLRRRMYVWVSSQAKLLAS